MHRDRPPLPGRNRISNRMTGRSAAMLRRRPLAAGVEKLEDRCLLATIVWDGEGGDNAWGNAANWFDQTNGANNVLPTSADDVEIRAEFSDQVIQIVSTLATVNSLHSAAGIHVQSGYSGSQLRLLNTSQIDGPVTLASGSLGGGGTLTITDTLTLNGGTLSDGGMLMIAPGATLVADASISVTSSGPRTIENNGTIVWNRGTINASDPLIINNRPQGLFDIRDGNRIAGNGSVVNNEGTLRKSDGLGRSEISTIFNNTGSVEVASGTLALTRGGASSGDFSFATDTTLELRGGDDFFNNSHIITLAGDESITGQGRLLIADKPITIQGTGVLDIVSLEISTRHGARLNLNLDASVPHVLLANGLFGGTGTLTVTERMDWTGGQIHEGGTVLVTSDATLLLDATSVGMSTGGGTIDNYGTFRWLRGAINASGSSSLTLHNRAGALWDIQSNAAAGAGGSVVNNAGIIRKSAGTGLSELRMAVHNTGTVQVQTGTLALNRGGTSTGNFSFAAGTTLELGEHDGAPHLITLGAVNSLQGAGRLLVSSGQATIGGSGIMDVKELELQGSFVDLHLDLDTTVPDVRLTGGTLGGSGTLTVTDNMLWSNSQMADSGTTLIGPQATLTIQGNGVSINDNNSSTTPTRTIDNFGIIQWLSGNVFIGDPLVLRNHPGALFDIRTNATLGHQGSLINNGTVRKLASSGLTTIDMVVTGSGIWDVERGEVRLVRGLRVDGTGVMTGDPRSTVTVNGNLLGDTRSASPFEVGSQVRFTGGNSSSPRLLEVMSRDRGPAAAGFLDNFLYERLALNGAFLRLVDQSDNVTGGESEALYVNNLIVPTNNTLDLNGLAVYARSAQLDGNVLNGMVTVVPDGGSLPANQMTPGTISVAGEVDEWNFFGRVGDVVSLVATTGGTAFNSPVAPHLGFVHFDLIDPNGSVIASQSSASSGVPVELLGVTLATEGVYDLRVRTPDTHPSTTGNYQFGVFDATIDVSPLTLNRTHFGTLETQYSTDRWQFSAGAGQQVRFNLGSASSPGARFQLTGPGGIVLFQDQAGSSELITLPSAGPYVLEATEVQGHAPVAYSFRLDATQVADLPPNTTSVGSFAGSGHAQLFRVPLTTAQRLRLILDDSASDNHNELYAKFGAPPTRSDYHYRFGNFASADQQIVVDNALAGDWYVLVYSAATSSLSGYSLTATAGEILLDTVAPPRHGNSVPAVLKLTGAGFTSETTVALVDPGGTAYAANSVTLDQPTQIRATFAAGSIPVGTYTVRVTGTAGHSSELPAAFEMTSGGQSHLETNLVLPSVVGRHQLATIYVEYANTGEVAMPAPLLVLSATDRALMTLDQTRVTEGLWTTAAPDGFGDTVHIIGSGATPGVLQPGESIRMPVYFVGLLQPWNFADDEVDFNLTVTTEEESQVIDWNAIRDASRPAHVPADVWQHLWSLFANSTGDTWGDYVRMINTNAAYLHSVGQPIVDASQAFNFALYQLGEMSPLPQFNETADAEVPVSGMALRWTRSFATTLVGRHRDGILGKGWSHLWDTAAERLTDGTVVITMQGLLRRFQPDSRGTNYFSENGDASTLVREPNGALRLHEPDGLLIAYRTDGRLDFVEEPNGNRITVGYTGNRITALTHTAGSSLNLHYNAAGRLDRIVDSFGRQTLYVYDAVGDRLQEVHHADGTIRRYTYDTSPASAAFGALLSASWDGGAGRSFTYDALGRMASTHLEGGAETIAFQYPGQGQIELTDAAGNSLRMYLNQHGQVAKAEELLGGTTFYGYDHDQNLVRTVDPLGRVEVSSYNLLRNLTSQVNALGDTLQFGYSDWSHLVSTIDANGNLTRYVRDAAGNLSSRIFADGSLERQGHDPLGNVVRVINRRNTPIDLSYNLHGQLTQKGFADGSTIDYQYDNRGNLVSVADASGTIVMTYDSGDRMIRVTYPNGRFVAYTYDAAGRRTRVEDSTGNVVNYSFDAAGRLVRLSNADDVTITSYAYDAAGRLTRQDQGNGAFTTYEYDDDRVVRLVNHAADGSTTSQFEYAYDLAGRRIGMTTLDGAWAYSYDAVGRLIHAAFASLNPLIPDQDLEYHYDAMGNRVRTVVNGVESNYVVNDLNQYTQFGSTAESFDADGNLELRAADGQITTFEYDDENRLVTVIRGSDVWTYEYDALGNRKAVVHNGQRTEYLVDPAGISNVIGQFDASGSLVQSYQYGLGLVSRIDGAGSAAYFQFDALGSTVGLLDQAGSALNSYSYLPFGETLAATESVANAFTYVGSMGVMAEDSGLIYMRNRFYEPQAGTFLSMDPLRLPNDHLYAYANNNPVEFVDPLGLRGGLEGLCYVEGDGYIPCDRGGEPDFNPIPPGTNLFDLIVKLFKGDCAGRNFGNGMLIVTGRSDQVIANYERDRREGGGGACSGGGAVPPPPPGGSGGGGSGGVVGSQDPNEKIGPGGVGDDRFVRPGSLLPYRINFENLESATAPAQQVVVTDQLEGAFDWSTLEITSVGFGDVWIPVQPGSQYFSTAVSMEFNGQTFDVQIEVTFDVLTGVLVARFQSIDPLTLLPPDVLTGFLPPEDGTGRGQGHVSYVIRARSDLQTGDMTRNVALIVFDGQQTIATNQIDPLDPGQGTDPLREARNTIDAGGPTSSIDGLPPQVQTVSFVLSWFGTDDAGGSGIANFDVYVSQDSGPFLPMLLATTETSTIFTGEFGRTYGFYSIARDLVGHVQPTPTSAQATTTIVLPDCDLDTDGDCEIDDLDALIAEIAAGTHNVVFDLTGDGLVNLDDRDLWLVTAGALNLPSGNPYLLGDADLDGSVSGKDFNVWNAHKFTAVAAWSQGDFNADGVVDGSDFNIWNVNKFQNSALSPPIQLPPIRFGKECFSALIADTTARDAVWAMFDREPQEFTL